MKASVHSSITIYSMHSFLVEGHRGLYSLMRDTIAYRRSMTAQPIGTA